MSDQKDLNAAIWLPADVMVCIFQILSPPALAAAAATCKYWCRCAAFPQLSWTTINHLELVTRETAFENSSRETGIHHGFASAVGIELGSAGAAWMLDSQCRRIVSVARQRYDTGWNPWESMGNPIRNQKDIDGKLWRLWITHSKTTSSDEFRIEVQLNRRKFEEYVREGKAVPYLEFLLVKIRSELYKSVCPPKFDFHSASLKKEEEVKFDQPEGFASAVQLLDFQRTAVHWMITTEKKSETSLKYCPLVSWRRLDALFDVSSDDEEEAENESAAQKVYTMKDGKEKFCEEVKFRGGVLSDEEGLGKTLDVLGLILANPASSSDFLIREPDQDLIPTKATLILCPNHLTDRWLSEIRSHTPKLRVVLISVSEKFTDLKMNDLVSADVVVVSISFIVSRLLSADQIEERKNQLKNDTSFEYLNHPASIVLVRWYRVVLDEAPAAFESYQCSNIISKIHSDYRWIVSCAPFAFEDLLIRGREFLRSEPPKTMRRLYCYSLAAHEEHMRKTEIELMLKNCYWRNTKESVGLAKISNPKHETFLIDFHPIESLFYEYHFQEDGKTAVLSSVCSGGVPLCDGYLSSCYIATDFRSQLQELLTDGIGDRKEKLEQSTKRKPKRSKKQDLAAAAENLEKWKKEVVFFEELLKKLNEIPQETPLKSLLERSTDSNEEDLGAAADDNFDDFDANEKKKKKPKKKMKMKSIPLERRGKTNEKEEEGAKRKKRDEDLEEADDEEPLKGKRVKKPTAAKKPSVQEEYSLPQLVMRYGSKPAHLLHWIHKLLASNQDARVIIFARGDLSFYHKMMKFHNIECRCNIGKYNYVEDTVRVVLLDSAREERLPYSMEASHIVLIDPMIESPEEVNVLELNAIDRAYRLGQKSDLTVVRFVIRNTIDHELYLKYTKTFQH